MALPTKADGSDGSPPFKEYPAHEGRGYYPAASARSFRPSPTPRSRSRSPLSMYQYPAASARGYQPSPTPRQTPRGSARLVRLDGQQEPSSPYPMALHNVPSRVMDRHYGPNHGRRGRRMAFAFVSGDTSVSGTVMRVVRQSCESHELSQELVRGSPDPCCSSSRDREAAAGPWSVQREALY